MKKEMTLRSGTVIRSISRKDAEAKNYLSRQTLSELHLMPSGDPIAFEESDGGHIIYYFDPEKVVEAPVEMWYAPTSRKETYTLESGQPLANITLKKSFSK